MGIEIRVCLSLVKKVSKIGLFWLSLFFSLFATGLFWLSSYGEVYTFGYDIRHSRELVVLIYCRECVFRVDAFTKYSAYLDICTFVDVG